MPELPEVETIARGLAPHVEGLYIEDTLIRQHQLRWPIPTSLPQRLKHQHIKTISRRGKYLLFKMTQGTLIVHLGMSGQLRLVQPDTPVQRHDHVDLLLANRYILRYTDPRRFGSFLWADGDPYQDPRLASLGVEPLTASFTPEFLMQQAASRRMAIKPFIMNNHIVVGVGNIYAAEALFLARIHPLTPANQLTHHQHQNLVQAIKYILQQAIQQGGTTIKDFINSEGRPGYFTQHLSVYGRAGQACMHCHHPLQYIRIGQRSTVFCATCQPLMNHANP